jgi:hypothetical protein
MLNNLLTKLINKSKAKQNKTNQSKSKATVKYNTLILTSHELQRIS